MVSGPDSGPDCLKTNSGPDSGPECLMMPQMCMALTSKETFRTWTAMKGYEGHAAWKKDFSKKKYVETKALSNQQSLKVWKAGILYLNQFAVHITVFNFIWNVVNPEDRFGPRLGPRLPQNQFGPRLGPRMPHDASDVYGFDFTRYLQDMNSYAGLWRPCDLKEKFFKKNMWRQRFFPTNKA